MHTWDPTNPLPPRTRILVLSFGISTVGGGSLFGMGLLSTVTVVAMDRMLPLLFSDPNIRCCQFCAACFAQRLAMAMTMAMAKTLKLEKKDIVCLYSSNLANGYE